MCKQINGVFWVDFVLIFPWLKKAWLHWEHGLHKQTLDFQIIVASRQIMDENIGCSIFAMYRGTITIIYVILLTLY